MLEHRVRIWAFIALRGKDIEGKKLFLEHVKYVFTCSLVYFNKKPIQDKLHIFFIFTDDEVEE